MLFTRGVGHIRVSRAIVPFRRVGGIERSFQRRCRSIPLFVLQRPRAFRFISICLRLNLRLNYEVIRQVRKQTVTTEVYGHEFFFFSRGKRVSRVLSRSRVREVLASLRGYCATGFRGRGRRRGTKLEV